MAVLLSVFDAWNVGTVNMSSHQLAQHAADTSRPRNNPYRYDKPVLHDPHHHHAHHVERDKQVDERVTRYETATLIGRTVFYVC